MEADKRWFTVCVLRCSDDTLLATLTDGSPADCVSEHNAGRGHSYAIGRRPVLAEFAVDAGSDVDYAIGVLWAIRELTRSAKERLCGGCPATLHRILARAEEIRPLGLPERTT